MCHRHLMQFICGHVEPLLFMPCGKMGPCPHHHKVTQSFEPYPEECHRCLVKKAASGGGFVLSYPVFSSRQLGWIWMPMGVAVAMALPRGVQAAPTIPNPQPYRPLTWSAIQQIQARSSNTNANSSHTSDSHADKASDESSMSTLGAIYIPSS